ncbi:M56 family metallopeptidase [Lapillicoccus jejuensis]|uniref:Peptidase M48-like protein n=1 Tax=Lapillicoccus jejuensis TaxID=402171 RepID=A0A542DYK7_9MICO|nr:M56 family metallopeptidase [Lapillicoccus jejuensis]TQJ08180.1 peptidase M48-like protein [Lapillicoccus jejuensis]
MGSPPTGAPLAAGLLLLLLLLAVVLAGPGPRLMAAQHRFRSAPGPALLVWQAVTTAAVLAAVLTGAVGVRLILDGGTTPARVAVAVPAVLVGAGTLALLLLSGHRVGTRLRAARRRHRDLVDVLATPDGRGGPERPGDLRVLDHPTPTAYCVPGLRRRVVLTRGTLERLAAEELDAVLAHERAHLDSRHDLVLEYFTVVHEAVPARVRSEAALREVRLLVEALADRVAARRAGPLPLARALVALAGSAHPEATLGAGPTTAAGAAAVRLELLDRSAPRARVAVMLGFAVGVLAVPLVLAALAWSAAGSAG